MIIEISDPATAEDLVEFLHGVRCDAEVASATRISASFPHVSSEADARGMLESYLAAWQAGHPGARARRKPRYDL